MEAFRDEHEQVEALKRFWRENGKSIIAGVIIGLGVMFGWQAWVKTGNMKAEAASMEYMGMIDSMTQGSTEIAIEHGGRIVGQYPDTTYAALASLGLAKMKLESGDMVAARAHLKWVIANTNNDAIKDVARLRLSQLLLSEGEHDQAIKLLDEVRQQGFASMRHELLGDIYAVQDNYDKAREAYASALKNIDDTAGGRTNLIKMKLDDLGGDNFQMQGNG